MKVKTKADKYRGLVFRFFHSRSAQLSRAYTLLLLSYHSEHC